MLQALVLFALLALAIFLIVRTVQGRSGVVRSASLRSAAPPPAVAPDDDANFLRDLDRKRKHPDDPQGI